jgi:hypothetical protein
MQLTEEENNVLEVLVRHGNFVFNTLIQNLRNALAEKRNSKIQELISTKKSYGVFANFRRANLFF